MCNVYIPKTFSFIILDVFFFMQKVNRKAEFVLLLYTYWYIIVTGNAQYAHFDEFSVTTLKYYTRAGKYRQP